LQHDASLATFAFLVPSDCEDVPVFRGVCVSFSVLVMRMPGLLTRRKSCLAVPHGALDLFHPPDGVIQKYALILAN
jgi:hypothetical protein